MDCPECGTPLYETTCPNPNCDGRGCQNCGYGCNADFLPRDESTCHVGAETWAVYQGVREAWADMELDRMLRQRPGGTR